MTISGATGVSLGGNIVTTGADSNAGTGSAGGAVTVTTTDGPITLANVTAIGGNSTFGGGAGGVGGAISVQAVDAGGGPGPHATLLGQLLAQGGLNSALTTNATGGAISVNTVANSGTGLTTLAGPVTTTNADIDIRGSSAYMTALCITDPGNPPGVGIITWQCGRTGFELVRTQVNDTGVSWSNPGRAKAAVIPRGSMARAYSYAIAIAASAAPPATVAIAATNRLDRTRWAVFMEGSPERGGRAAAAETHVATIGCAALADHRTRPRTLVGAHPQGGRHNEA